jgi:hypothetical protein
MARSINVFKLFPQSVTLIAVLKSQHTGYTFGGEIFRGQIGRYRRKKKLKIQFLN